MKYYRSYWKDQSAYTLSIHRNLAYTSKYIVMSFVVTCLYGLIIICSAMVPVSSIVLFVMALDQLLNVREHSLDNILIANQCIALFFFITFLLLGCLCFLFTDDCIPIAYIKFDGVQ